jgi:hypothetical protein
MLLKHRKLFLSLQWLLILLALFCSIMATSAYAATPKSSLTVSSASWSAKSNTLSVHGKIQHSTVGAAVELFDINGRRLGTPSVDSKGGFSLTLTGNQLSAVPCQVRAQSGDLEKTKPVSGAPNTCSKTLACQITAPLTGHVAEVNTPVQFNAAVKLPKTIKHPKYEWDFAGGAMGEELTNTGLVKTYKRPDSTQASVAFVRNNSRYRVRFSVVDGDASPSVGTPQYRCEDSVDIVVGVAPDVPPGVPTMAATSVASAPAKGSENNGTAGDLVVLPFQDWTMQHFQDGFMPLMINFPAGNWIITNLNAQVIKKGSVGSTDGPKLLTSDSIDLLYSSAANPADPSGSNSINSTSQNWPLNADITQAAPLLSSTIQKSDWWEIPTHNANDQVHPAAHYVADSWMQDYYAWSHILGATVPGLPKADEGYFPYFEQKLVNYEWSDAFGPTWDAQGFLNGETSLVENARSRVPPNVTHGSYMPGVNNPYVANDTQPFTLFDTNYQWFVAQTVPITDIDDKGSINPKPLLRVEAVDKGTSTSLAKTDAVLATSRDLHCRGCHGKGQIAANPAVAFVPGDGKTLSTAAPTYFNLTDLAALNPDLHIDPNNHDPINEEYAAAVNILQAHAFYSPFMYPAYTDFMTKGGNYGGPTIGDSSPQLYQFDIDIPCSNCHVTEINKPQPFTKGPLITGFTDEDLGVNTGGDGASYSRSMHNFHGRLQFNADKSDIVRDANGANVRFDTTTVTTRTANADPNPKTLFPIFGADGKQLPMEQNCLKCHSGHREPLYNDRMYTAGVTCFDCHGDMLAMGKAWTKDPAKQGSKHLADYRLPWMDETDCGSCHVGNANVGKNDATKFFSGGVRKRAFADTDPAGISIPVNKADPDSVRFAVVPDHEYEYMDNSSTSLSTTIPVKVDLPLYRYGKDSHGQVACAACHGAAHAVAPNRDPSANDNVTALELQGYPGHILECNVCHTKDAFKDLANLDGSTASGLPVGVLGGPHNMHPVNDPNWYLQRSSGPERNSDGTQYGGWHNVMSGKPGVKNEDQCAACHGDDHMGTRLSKTPVDRVFDFSSLDFKKLKALGFKKKVINVAAGSIIGCNTCHSVETSRKKTPPGPVITRHSPVISDTPAPTSTIGEAFSYPVNAADDSNSLSYSLSGAPDGMSITGSGEISWSHVAANPDDAFTFKVIVEDASGLTASRWFIVKPSCPASAQYWDAGLSQCSSLQITSTAPSGANAGINAGQVLNYTATTSSPANFSIIDVSTGLVPTFTPQISINPQGVINWTPDSTTPATVNFRIIATAQDNSGQATQDFSLSVCQSPKTWSSDMWMCM